MLSVFLCSHSATSTVCVNHPKSLSSHLQDYNTYRSDHIKYLITIRKIYLSMCRITTHTEVITLSCFNCICYPSKKYILPFAGLHKSTEVITFSIFLPSKKSISSHLQDYNTNRSASQILMFVSFYVSEIANTNFSITSTPPQNRSFWKWGN